MEATANGACWPVTRSGEEHGGCDNHDSCACFGGMQPTIRQPVYDAYWRFAAERQRIFHRRFRGEDLPWTPDPILARFKFCNAYRASDRVSQYLIKRVIYDPEPEGTLAEDMFLRVVLFRLFSRESTWEELERATGGVKR